MGALGRAGAAAGLALDRHRQIERTRRAECRFFEREVHHGLGVLTARRPGRPASAAERVAAEERVEEIVQTELGAAEAGRRAEPFGTERVVAATFLRIAQGLVRNRDLLEVRLGLGVTGIRIRVVLTREDAVRLLDLVIGRAAGDAEDLVEVLHQAFRARARAIG